MNELAKTCLNAARLINTKIASAESCTGGMLASSLTDIAGSSDVFDRGFITYSNDAKIDMLDVKTTTLDAHGAVSEQVAREMAIGAVTHSNADIGISITGIAGPGGSDHKPEGRVCFGIHFRNISKSQTIEFGALGRNGVRKAARDHALNLLISTLQTA